jgi:predicted DNA-binding ribbon-helix-helix protein
MTSIKEETPVLKRSIVIAGRKTSVSLEDAFWNALKEIAAARGMTLSDLVAAIDSKRQHSNLSSALRLFVLDFYRNPAVSVLQGATKVARCDSRNLFQS